MKTIQYIIFSSLNFYMKIKTDHQRGSIRPYLYPRRLSLPFLERCRQKFFTHWSMMMSVYKLQNILHVCVGIWWIKRHNGFSKTIQLACTSASIFFETNKSMFQLSGLEIDIANPMKLIINLSYVHASVLHPPYAPHSTQLLAKLFPPIVCNILCKTRKLFRERNIQFRCID